MHVLQFIWCKLEVQKLWGHVKINSKALRRDKVGCFMTALFFLNMLSGVIRGILECGILFSYLLSHQKKVSHNTLLIKCLVVPMCYQLIPPWSNKVIWKKPNVKSIFAINRCSNSLSPSWSLIFITRLHVSLWAYIMTVEYPSPKLEKKEEKKEETEHKNQRFL